jgi:hypothetical protein
MVMTAATTHYHTYHTAQTSLKHSENKTQSMLLQEKVHGLSAEEDDASTHCVPAHRLTCSDESATAGTEASLALLGTAPGDPQQFHDP